MKRPKSKFRRSQGKSVNTASKNLLRRKDVRRQVEELTALLDKSTKALLQSVPTVSDLRELERLVVQLAADSGERKNADEFLHFYGAIKGLNDRWPKMGLLAFYERLANSLLKVPVWPVMSVKQKLVKCLSNKGRKKYGRVDDVVDISIERDQGNFWPEEYEKAERLRHLANLLSEDWSQFPAPRTLGRNWPKWPPTEAQMRQWLTYSGNDSNVPTDHDFPWDKYPEICPTLFDPGVLKTFNKASPECRFFLGYLAVVDLHRRNVGWVQRYGDHFVNAVFCLLRYGNDEWTKRLQDHLPFWFESPDDLRRQQETYNNRRLKQESRARKSVRIS